MKRPVRLLSLFAACLCPTVAPAMAHAQQSPTIDRKALFGEVQIDAAQISPDGKQIAFQKPYKDVRNI